MAKKVKRRTRLPYPRTTLRETLRIAQSIEDNNAGAPYNRLDLAQSLNYSPETGHFRVLIASSTRYGLTKGSYNAEKLELTELGEAIVAPRSDEERNSALLKSLRNPLLFRKVIDRFNQSRFPREDLLKNTLTRDFQIPQEDVNQFLEVLKKNFDDYGLLVKYKDNIWLRSDKLSSVREISEEIREEDDKDVEIEHEGEEPCPPEPVQKRIFISHSKNVTILDQLKTILEYGQFDFIVAEDVETASIPIPEKIFGLMRQCNGAIINISADEQEKKPDGTYGVNANVLIEIGAAFFGYEKRIILLTDKRVKLPSNLQGLYRCEYEGKELSFNTYLKLQKALTAFR